MTCGFCHIGLNPLNPPKDPENPRWSNLSARDRESVLQGRHAVRPEAGCRRTFAGMLRTANQPALRTHRDSRLTTSSTRTRSIPSCTSPTVRPHGEDGRRLNARSASHPERRRGFDRHGGRSLRVYVNIGMCSDYWTTLHDPIAGQNEAEAISYRSGAEGLRRLASDRSADGRRRGLPEDRRSPRV